MNRRGFTFVELLATIVIMSILVIVITPKVVKIVEDSKKAAFKQNITSIIDAVNYYMVNNNIDVIPTEGIDIFNLDLKNASSLISGKVYTDENGNKVISRLSDGNLCATGNLDEVIISNDCDSLDNTAPIIYPDKIETIYSTSSIEVILSDLAVIDRESKIQSYKLEISNEELDYYDSVTTTNKNYKFRNLKQNVEYKIIITVTNTKNMSTKNELIIKTMDINSPTYITDNNSWSDSKTVTITYPLNDNNYIYEYSVDGGLTFKKLENTNTIDLIFDSNGTLVARIYDGKTYLATSTYEITKIDSTIPDISANISNITSSAITVNTLGIDLESGIYSYEFAIDGSAYIDSNGKLYHTFDKLEPGVHKIHVRVYNNAGLYSEMTLTAWTNQIFAPKFELTNGENSYNEKEITITYPTNNYNLSYQYSIDGGLTFKTLKTGDTVKLVLRENVSLIAKIYSGEDYVTSSTYTVSGIDTSGPIVALDVLSNENGIVNLDTTASDLDSSIIKYEYKIDNDNYIDNGVNSSYSFSELSVGEHVIKVRVTNGANLSTIKQITVNVLQYKISPNEPVLESGMIPVIYDSTKNSWIKADINNGWYDYDNKIWANAVTVLSSGTKTRSFYQSAPVGTSISISDITTMWVWIPRYEYRITGTYGLGGKSITSPGEIEVLFVRDKAKVATSGYTINSAFTFNSEELTGIWVGKFENSATTISNKQAQDNLDTKVILIKPGVQSLRYQQLGVAFRNIRKMELVGNYYGFSQTSNSTTINSDGTITNDSNNIDTHLIKNNEWGAVAYLSQSSYGKYGNSSYSGTNKEIYNNNYTGYNTGCSSGAPSSASAASCKYNYSIANYGVGASTTGTIYGIYDMNGGASEFVMGIYGSLLRSSGFTALPNSDYYNSFTSTTISSACSGIVCYGGALSETNNWYSDAKTFVSSTYPWLIRGGRYSATSGVFAYEYSNGTYASTTSSRSILILTS